MIKVLSITELRSNLTTELDHVCKNMRNKIIVKRPKEKGNVVLLSQDAFNDIVKAIQLYSNK